MLLSPHISDGDQSRPSLLQPSSPSLRNISNNCLLPLGHFMKCVIFHEQRQEKVGKSFSFMDSPSSWGDAEFMFGAMKHSEFIPHLGHRSQTHGSTEGVFSLSLSQHIIIDALRPALAWCPTRRSGFDVPISWYVSTTTAGWLLLCNKEVLFSHSEQPLWHLWKSNKACLHFCFVWCLFHVFFSVTFMEKFFLMSQFYVLFFFF